MHAVRFLPSRCRSSNSAPSQAFPPFLGLSHFLLFSHIKSLVIRNKVGDTVSVKLLEAVSVADEVIIPKGTVLEGYLKKVQKGKLLSQKGVIRMRLKDYYLPNGYLLRLNNEEIKFSGDMNYTSLAAGVAVPFAGLAFKGKNVSCKPGMQFKYKLAHDVAVERY